MDRREELPRCKGCGAQIEKGKTVCAVCQQMDEKQTTHARPRP